MVAGGPEKRSAASEASEGGEANGHSKIPTMRLAGLIIAALVLGQVEPQDVELQGRLLFEEAELTLRRESDPVRLAHGAIVIAGLAKDVEGSRVEPLLRMAAQALSKLEVESALERERKRTGRVPRVFFRSPYDVDVLWEKWLEQAVGFRVELVREFLPEIRGDERWKGSVLSRIARSVKDDDRARRVLVELSLSQAISFDTVSLLFELREKDPELGRALFRSALERAIRQGDLESLYWLGAYAIPGVNLPNRFPLADPPAPDPGLSRVYIRALVDVLSQVAFQAPRMPTHIYRALVNIRPHAEQFAPEIVPQIDSLPTFVVSRLSPEAIQAAERSDLERATPRPEKIEDLERAAQRAKDDKAHDDLMAYAAFLALTERECERALSLASKIKDRTTRFEMQDLINFNAAVELSGKNQLDHAETHALAIEHPERLAVAVASVLQKLNDRTRADALIARTQARIERLQTGGAKGRAFLYLAGPVLSFDAEQGRFLLSRAIHLFNATKADLNGAVDSAIRIETGEFAIGRVIGSYDLASVVIEAFTKATESDPELVHAPSLAMMWESAEIRAIAQAAIARSFMERAKRGADSIR